MNDLDEDNNAAEVSCNDGADQQQDGTGTLSKSTNQPHPVSSADQDLLELDSDAEIDREGSVLSIELTSLCMQRCL